MFTIRHSDAGWEVLDASGNVVGEAHSDYSAAIAALSGLLGEMHEYALAAGDEMVGSDGVPDGALPFRWESGPDGSAQLAETGPSRDFSTCVFTFRPGPLALMLKDTASHGGFDDGPARLAGWSDLNELRDGVPYSSGWLHDNEAGREALRIMRAQGRFGVSLDPGENVDAEFECVEFDDDGWCMSERVLFTAYEIAGQTMTPFPGFQDAYVQLVDAGAAAGSDDEADDDGEAAVAASGGRPPVEPAPEYFTMDPPPFDDGRWVTQLSTGLPAIPLDITDRDADGWRHVYGFAAAADVCHIGYQDECITYPPSPTGFANFHLHSAHDRDGGRHAVGRLVFGQDHLPLAGVNLVQARDGYANTNLSWASVVARDVYAPADCTLLDLDGEPIAGRLLGCWVTGVVMPHVSDDAVRVLRASGLSGDWREERSLGQLDMVGIQSVNVPGFPITRVAMAAAGIELAQGGLRVRRESGRTVAATGIGIVRRGEEALDALAAAGTVRCGTCPEPAELTPASSSPAHTGNLGRRALSRRQHPRRPAAAAPDPRLDDLARLVSGLVDAVGKVEARTRHLIPVEGEARRAAITASAD